MYIFSRRRQIKILEKNADQITFTIGQKQSYFLKVFTIIPLILILGYSIVLIPPLLITDILEGKFLSSILLLCLYLLFVAGCVDFCFYKVHFSLCKFYLKTHEIDLFQEILMRKKHIHENLDNFFTFQIRTLINDDWNEYAVNLELVSKKHICLGIIEGIPEDYRALDEIEKWIRKHK